MDSRKQQLNDFFDRYEARFNNALKGGDADIDGTVNSFASCFVGANPTGVACGKNDEEFRNATVPGYDFYKSIGTTSIDIVSKEITLLDDFHAMTKIHWKSNNVRKDNTKLSIEFDVFYFTQTLTDGPKIFAYITGDEQKALKEAGLM